MLLHVSENWEGYTVGAKALRLQQISTELSVEVPAFVVIPAESLSNGSYEAALQKLDELLPGSLFAVRSAALSEDTRTAAKAGAFLTKLAVSQVEVAPACKALLADAKEKGVESAQFSIIIQTYLAPDLSGVVFSKDPRGYDEVMIEYVVGTQDSVVGGDAPVSVCSKGGQYIPDTVPAPVQELPHIALQLESMFGWPQDIEWVSQNGLLSVVQSRDITSFTAAQVAGFALSSAQVKKSNFCYLEQTTTVENFARPSVLNESFLRSLYRHGGPIASVYKKYGVRYQSTEQFARVGAQLYVDKEQETKSLFPAMGHKAKPGKKPHVEQFRGIWTTVRNMQQFGRITPCFEKVDLSALVDYLQSEQKENSVAAVLEIVDTMYPIIFEINLLSQLALQKVSHPIDAEVIQVAGLIAVRDVKRALAGNSLSLDDRSTFVSVAMQETTDSHALWLQYRELGRWASVALATALRNAIEERGGNLWGLYLEELLRGDYNNERSLERSRLLAQYDAVVLPSVIASFPIGGSSAVVPVSGGVAEGMLCDLESLASTTGPKILLLESLAIDAATQLSHVSGVVSRRGGVLSHLAIVAREQGIPVVVTSQLLAVGSVVRIDGTTGKLEVLSQEV